MTFSYLINHVFPQSILIIIGLFTIAGGVFNREWFIGHWKSRLFMKLFGRTGTSIFYIFLGVIVTGLGVFWLN